MKNKLLTIYILPLFLFLILEGTHLQHNETQKKEINWQESNSKYFIIKHPSDWVASITDTSISIVNQSNEFTKYEVIQTNLKEFTNLRIDEIYSIYMTDFQQFLPEFRIINEYSVKIANNKAKQLIYSWRNGKNDIQVVEYFILHNEKLINFSGATKKKLFQDYLPVFEQITKSFQYLQ